ncbi:MAG TPA: flagellar basal-body rod protein FlgF [Candidatus Atribacteria bacterium]|nr:flagellar basal-body rod protein FlgF [Candidatus Atribacteria bacterium]
MIRGIYTATSALNLQELKQETWANNIANLDTPGFKKELTWAEAAQEANLFRFLSSQNPYPLGEMTAGVQPGTEKITDFSPGRLEETGNSLDLAIEGDGFFVVSTPSGEAYTRAGNFQLDGEGRLVTVSGYPVMGEGGEIILPDRGTVSVDEQGNILVDGEEIEQLRIVDFANRSAIRKSGENLFIAEGVAPQETTNFNLRQGFLEKSNLDPVEAMVTMMEALREYEIAQRMLVSQDEALQKAVNNITQL